ncbi:hypothetical protein BV918_13580 [Pectobacterium odoriferum]|nr:hypothetical protein BV925_13440 [Pectobacterium odoriferum]POD99793.1 hypothetical protein BVY05_15375 [Pectobacterium odoriferum]POE17199.1 hypothetical protein BV918_13580 [Pectobacterium odoriferum]POE34721.1 hypothetical protein BV922_12200 [Pectobacterium odoriferum]
MRWLPLNTRPVVGLALKGRCKQRSNLLPADLSPPVTYLSKLLGIRAVAACKQLELFRIQIRAV